MSVTPFLFYLFAAILLFSAFRVVTASNTVHAVLYLVLAFAQGSCLWMMLGAEFLSITLILVYVGAVMVLFMFVVMMLDIREDALRQGFWKHFPLAATMGVLIALEMAAILMGGFGGMDEPKALAVVLDAAGNVVPYSNAKALGQLMYTKYLYPVEIASVILLVGMVAAIALTLRRRKDSKAIDPALQVRVRSADRVRLVKVTATQKAAADSVVVSAGEEKKA